MFLGTFLAHEQSWLPTESVVTEYDVIDLRSWRDRRAEGSFWDQQQPMDVNALLAQLQSMQNAQ